MSVFNRLAGLETEYAIRFHPDFSQSERPSNWQFYHRLIAALERRIPLADAQHIKTGVFLANGGAVWFERIRQRPDSGLIEGSSPECRGPRQLLAAQRAQDQLLSEAADGVRAGGSFHLCKSDRDSLGNFYGAQENYECELAASWRLALWRAGLVLLVPLLLVSWVATILLIALIVAYFLTALLLAGALWFVLPDRLFRPLLRLLIGEELATGDDHGGSIPEWLEVAALWGVRVTAAPLALVLVPLLHVTAFSRVRRQLLPFLISRAVFAGSGRLTDKGEFQIASKGSALNCLVGFNGYLHDRPLFSFGHFFKVLFYSAALRPRDFLQLFESRQRLQICLGDSNMAEEAEYLRVGTTLLVLDAIEAGALPRVPRIRRPLKALRAIIGDPTLQRRVRLSGGRNWTALEIQRFYLNACRKFLSGRPDASEEARDVLRRWEETLDALQRRPEELIGRVDWVTKKFLLDEAGRGLSWEARKKLDLRYHELSPEGYFQQLCTTGLVPPVLEPAEVERAMRMPPPRTPASARGHYIREFAGSRGDLSVNWGRVVLGRGLGAKVIDVSGTRPRRRRSRSS